MSHLEITDSHIQWNLWVKDSLGSAILSLAERLSLSRRVLYLEVPLYFVKSSLLWWYIYNILIAGTYNNQYMILDLKRINISHGIDDGALWVVEQIPGYAIL